RNVVHRNVMVLKPLQNADVGEAKRASAFECHADFGASFFRSGSFRCGRGIGWFLRLDKRRVGQAQKPQQQRQNNSSHGRPPHFPGKHDESSGHTKSTVPIQGRELIQRGALFSWRILPPSTTSDCPVMYAASRDARKHTAAATSSGVPARPTGVYRAASRSDSVLEAVAIHPGATPLIVIPLRAVSSATARIIPSIPAFAAPYALEPMLLTSGPVTELTFTIRPYSCFRMAGRTARVIRKAV